MKIHVAALALTLAATAGCSKSTDSAATPPADAAGFSESAWVAAPPAAPIGVVEARAMPAGGDEVAVVGRVADFVDGRAQFQLVDLKEEPCPPEEGCPTPWDYCCLTPKALAASTVFVEFREGARAVDVGLEGFHGFTHLREVVVSGALETDEHGNVTLVASGIHVKS